MKAHETHEGGSALDAPGGPLDARGGNTGEVAGEPADLDALAQAIEAAHAAARNVGIDPTAAAIDEDGELVRPNASYAFELSGLEDGPQLTDIEEALESLSGVSARLVYPTKMAWVTAPATMPLSDITDVIESFGIRTRVTDSTLRRRASGRYWQDHPIPRRSKRRLLDEASLIARAQGFVTRGPRVSKPVGDVLFTARDLVTPMRLWVALLLTLPVLLLTYVPALNFPGWQWVCLALTTPVALWCAWPFHRAMAGGVRRGISALDGASSIAILASYVWSLAVLLFTDVGQIGYVATGKWVPLDMGQQPELYLEVSCAVTLLLLAGRYFAIRARSDLLQEFEDRRPGADVKYEVTHRKGQRSGPEKLPATEIRKGDDVRVKAGQVIPVDGEVVGGSGRFDQELVDTHRDGKLKVGSPVWAGSVLSTGEVKVRAECVGHTTRFAGMQRWLEDSSRQQNATALLSTRSAGMLIPAAYTIAILDFALWLLFSTNLNTAFSTALAILIVVAPVSLALSPALPTRVGLEASVRNGILVRDGNALRTLAATDTAVFNRVGTLVQPQMTVETVTAAVGENSDLVLCIAGALSAESNHPASKALVKAARETRDAHSGDPHMPSRIEASESEATIDGEYAGRVTLRWGKGEDAHSETIDATLWRPTNLSQLSGRLSVAATTGGTPVVVRWQGKDRGVVTLYDPAKDDAIQAIDRLESMGVETVMLTRDTYPVARRFADFLGISQVLAGMRAPQKPGAVRALHTQGATVAMVGDSSVLPVLRVADTGILFAGKNVLGADSPRWETSCDVVLIRDDVMAVPQLIEHSRRVKRIADTNMVFANVYNGAAMALAAVGVLPPVGATLLMLGSSLLIESNSRRARRFPG